MSSGRMRDTSATSTVVPWLSVTTAGNCGAGPDAIGSTGSSTSWSGSSPWNERESSIAETSAADGIPEIFVASASEPVATPHAASEATTAAATAIRANPRAPPTRADPVHCLSMARTVAFQSEASLTFLWVALPHAMSVVLRTLPGARQSASPTLHYPAQRTSPSARRSTSPAPRAWSHAVSPSWKSTSQNAARNDSTPAG